jgi:hypothetical protein
VSRSISRSAVVGGIVLTVLAAFAAPALAAAGEEGINAGKSLGLGLWILIYAGIPFSVFVIIALLVYGPALLRRPRYRPGYQDWGYRPVWIGGPADPDNALTAVAPDKVLDVRGGGAGARW